MEHLLAGLPIVQWNQLKFIYMEDFNENLTIVIPEPPDQTEGDIIKNL